jgi:alanine racemase
VILANREDAPRADRGGPQSTPQSEVSLAALEQNAQLAREHGHTTFAPSILAADAWGHGEDNVRSALASAGLAGSAAGTLDPHLLYGLPGGEPAGIPAMTLWGTVLSTKPLRAGEGVSYGYLHRATTDTTIALVTGGYAQGVARSLGGHAKVRIGDAQHPIVGRVAMDVCVVDIGAARVPRGATAIFFGDPTQGDPSLADWMTASKLTAAELVTAVGLRTRRADAS